MSGRGGRGGRGGRQDDPETRCGKAMSKLLRHSPPPGTMDEQGWMPLGVLLQHLKPRATEELVRRVVDSNDKKRFVLDDSGPVPRIRAAQGHSVQLADPVLQPVTDAAAVPHAVHVTSHESWRAIQSSGELRAMGRTHIHFATAPHHMRVNSWAQVFLKLRLEAALAAGHAFGLSSNGVLLCEGPLPVEFVEVAEQLPDGWQQQRQQRRQNG